MGYLQADAAPSMLCCHFLGGMRKDEGVGHLGSE